MPIIDISEKQLEELANSTVTKGLTVPGVQKNYHYIWMRRISLLVLQL
ncbi:hypothetical protein CIY_29020 [Butyrivibrio fibrisolvens 16/4]|nr:hypothetical protein CIY_29020 [Butyrivibrio fibrisolvens 16/4]